MSDLWVKQADGTWKERSSSIIIGPPPGSDWTVNGIPPAGKCLAGASCEGRSRTAMTAMESLVSGSAGLWRVYYAAGDYSNAASYAASDAAYAHGQGWVPWLSFKLSNNASGWAAAATGAQDAWAASIASGLGALSGPVWVAIHHEPEGDGVDANWMAMQRRLLPIFKAYPNIATSVIVQGYPEAFGNSSWDAWFPGPTYADIYGYDPYNWYSTDNNGTNWDELKPYYDDWNAWKASKGATYANVYQAIAETGYADAAAQVTNPPETTGTGAAWLTRAYTDLRAAGGVGFAYFNVQPNGESATRTWPCLTTPKTTQLGAVFDAADAYPF